MGPIREDTSIGWYGKTPPVKPWLTVELTPGHRLGTEIARLQPGHITIPSLQGLTSNDLFFLSDLPTLRSLYVMSHDRFDSTFVERLGQLTRLNLNCKPSSPVDLTQLTNLKSVSLNWHSGYASLWACSGLQGVFLDHFDGQDLSQFQHMNDLRYLGMSLARIVNLEGIAALTALCEVELKGCRLLTSLGGLDHRLSLRHARFGFNKKLTNIDAIASQHNLRWFILDDCGDIPSLEPATACTSLEKLALGKTKVIDGNLSRLRALSRLRCFLYRHYRHYDLPQNSFPSEDLPLPCEPIDLR